MRHRRDKAPSLGFRKNLTANQPPNRHRQDIGIFLSLDRHKGAASNSDPPKAIFIGSPKPIEAGRHGRVVEDHLEPQRRAGRVI